MYLTFEEFMELFPESDVTAEQFQSLEKRAEMQIDRLTFNRITASGFETLTDFQKERVRRPVALQVKFIHENSEVLDGVLSGYSISGVSMSFDKSRVLNIGGVVTSSEVYAALMQTGLMYRGV